MKPSCPKHLRRRTSGACCSFHRFTFRGEPAETGTAPGQAWGRFTSNGRRKRAVREPPLRETSSARTGMRGRWAGLRRRPYERPLRNPGVVARKTLTPTLSQKGEGVRTAAHSRAGGVMQRSPSGSGSKNGRTLEGRGSFAKVSSGRGKRRALANGGIDSTGGCGSTRPAGDGGPAHHERGSSG